MLVKAPNYISHMNWRLKAAIQNFLSYIPENISNSLYYRIQKKLGTLKNLNPESRLKAGIAMAKKIAEHGKSVPGVDILEVGTGRRLNLPIAFWLMGARRIVTVDLNHYLREELVDADLKYIFRNQGQIFKLFEGLQYQDRLNELLALISKAPRLSELMKFLNIEYIAPVDARRLPLDSESIDLHISFTVLEHIPPEVLKGIFGEGKRILRKDGLFVHRIDYSDHFSHSDPSISAINFLKFSEEQWARIAGNRFMYMNRLRADDFEELFQEMKLRILSNHKIRDDKLTKLLSQGLISLDQRFKSKPIEVLATIGSLVVASPH